MAELDRTRDWQRAESLDAFIEKAEANVDMWQALYARARIDDRVFAWAAGIAPFNLLVLAEDWCGDALNTLPLMARLAGEVEGVELRVLSRDQNPDLMDRHLTGTARSIPVVMVLDDQYRERAWWGPRPAPLQAWVDDIGMGLPKADRYRHVRTWYARDRGATTFHELLSLVESAARSVPAGQTTV